MNIAVKAARKALKDPSWKQLPATDRGQLMHKLADLIDKNREVLATIETWDNGMTTLPQWKWKWKEEKNVTHATQASRTRSP